MLGSVCLFAVLMFSFTAVIVNQYKIRLRHQSSNWASKGENLLAQGEPEKAIEDFRNALAYDPQNPVYQLHLAEALAKVNRLSEAETYLINLWQRDPASGTINLELAKLYAKQNNGVDAAVRYFQNAIYGFWETNPDQQRIEARLELVSFLLQNKRNNQADAELISLLPLLPRNTDSYVRSGNLFLRAGDYPRALDQFQRALHLENNNLAALAGAGRAAYQQVNLRLARQYLERVAALQPSNTEVNTMLATLQQVQQLDPFQYRLSRRERAARVRLAYQAAYRRLTACNPGSATDRALVQVELAQADALSSKMSRRAYLLNPDAIDSTMAFVFDAEALGNRICGPPQGVDLALQWIAKTRESS